MYERRPSEALPPPPVLASINAFGKPSWSWEVDLHIDVGPRVTTTRRTICDVRPLSLKGVGALKKRREGYIHIYTILMIMLTLIIVTILQLIITGVKI